ncbi:hypothetical protein H2203_001107 [Taxawa tesnikishii (nom. ined.)]|nr:hypothetical protein H2203_001107 [Dothideales sp. JES 119]
MFVRKTKSAQAENAQEPQTAPSPPSLDDHMKDYLQKQPTEFHHLVVSSAVLYKDRLLLIQRAAEERTYANIWEIPGGSADLSDKSVQDAIARELKEETGLTLTKVVAEILPPITFKTGWAPKERNWLRVSFVVDVEEVEEAVAKAKKLTVDLKQERKVGAGTSMAGKEEHDQAREVAAEYDRPGEVVVKHGDGSVDVVITLDPKEHQNYVWATKEDIINASTLDDITTDGPPGEDGRLELISDTHRNALLEAFRIHEQRATA